MLIVEQVMQFYEVVKPHENCLVTLKKGYSKFIFDKTWYEDIIKVKKHAMDPGRIELPPPPRQRGVIYGYFKHSSRY